MSFDDGQKRGYSCHFKDGRVETNLTYVESIVMFSDAQGTDNPCTIRAPGYGHDDYKAP